MTGAYPKDHRIGLYMRVDDGPETLVGTARNGDDVPHLLRLIAEEWQRKAFIEVDNKHYFATQATEVPDFEPSEPSAT